MPDKRKERAFIEETRRLYPWFPPGEIIEHEAPDFVLINGGDRLGIEVTQLYQPPRYGAKYPPHQIAAFHRRVMDAAERQSASMSPLDVLVYFNYRDPLSDVQKVAASLVEFVRTHPVESCETFSHPLPGFSVVRIAQPWAADLPRWRCLDTGETINVQWDLLASTIHGKNKRIARYRSHVDRTWLLVGSSFWEFASSFSFPSDIEDWRFEFDFDKVLLMSNQCGVYSLQRVTQQAASGHAEIRRSIRTLRTDRA